MEEAKIHEFQRFVLAYYQVHGRHDLPWRVPEADGSFDAYKILVSELMLQQTQVPRVISKYYEFLEKFPTIQSLARAALADVLVAWSGLGYNRRAKFLWQAAQMVLADFDGVIPGDNIQLVKLPGVGTNTAGAILAYAFDQPIIFIETNIRTVYIHHFFHDQTGVSDVEILHLVTQTLPKTDCRNWYWALMDYGSYLKQTQGNLNKLSKHYTKQSTFNGSKRQLRGQVLRLLAAEPKSLAELQKIIDDDRLPAVLSDLAREAMIRLQNGQYVLG